MRVCVCVCIGWCDRACNGMQCSPHMLRFCAHSPTELRAKACYTGIAWNDFTGKDENFHLGATCEQGSFGRKIVASYFQHTVESTCVFWLYLSIYHLFLPPNLPKLESAFLNMLIYPHSCAGAVHLKGPQTAQAKASTSGFSSPSAVCYGGEFVFNQPNSAPPTNELLVGCSYRPFNGTVFKGMKEKDFPPFF